MLIKRNMTFSIVGIALGITILITTASAASSNLKRLYVDYGAIKKIVVDGVEKKPSDGKKLFVANGTPYVPLQYIEDALGKEVDFDAKTGTITIESLPKTLNVWSFTDELPVIADKYKELHPNFNYEIKDTILSTRDNIYQQALDTALAAGGPDAPDIYGVETAFTLKYTQGEAAGYAAAYKDLGIDVDKLLKEADIARYTIDIGTRPSDKKIVGLTYQATGGVCIYRRSIAKDVWGTDNPNTIKTKIGPGWDQFYKAAAQLKSKGYGIVSGNGDIWRVIEGGSPTGWVVDGKLNIDPAREKFLDYAKELSVNGWSNNTLEWTDAWYADMSDDNEQKIFSYFGPSWLINYILADCSGNTFGDWAICEPPAGFFWGGTWILANKDTRKKDAVGDIIKWITLDSSQTGLQYLWANGLAYSSSLPQDTVPSGTVMKKSNGTLDFLGGQNMFDVFITANALATGKNRTDYDEMINVYWCDAVWKYTDGRLTRSEAIAYFRKQVAGNLGIY